MTSTMSPSNRVLNNSAQDYDVLLKILVVGDSGVGKSSLVKQYVDNYFDESFISTIGVDFEIITLNFEGKVVKLQIWDTAGQERFRAITSTYYHGAHGVLMVYDQTDEQSLLNLRDKWIVDVERFAPKNVSKIAVGNKADLVAKAGKHNLQVVDDGTVEMVCEELGVTNRLTSSARKGENVENVFLSMVRMMLRDRIVAAQEEAEQRRKFVGVEREIESEKGGLFDCGGCIIA